MLLRKVYRLFFEFGRKIGCKRTQSSTIDFYGIQTNLIYLTSSPNRYIMIKYALLSAVIGSITLFGTNANAQVNNLHNDKPNETNVLSKVNTDLENATEPKVYVIDDNGDKIYVICFGVDTPG